MTIQRIIDEKISVRNWISGNIHTALYPCSASDTKLFTYTHPSFYQHRKINESSPNLFVLIDKNDPFRLQNSPFEFNDNNIRITSHENIPVTIENKPGYILFLNWHSINPPNWGTSEDQNICIIFIVSDWEDMALYFNKTNWVPETFIGVCDGCSFGENEHCVNNLVTHGKSKQSLHSIPIPDYYITDHFQNADIPNPLSVGDIVKSTDRAFPYGFRKIGLLSSDWGSYGHGAIAGATLFKVINT